MTKNLGALSGSQATPGAAEEASPPIGFDPARSVFDRWRLYADRLYRNGAQHECDREYDAWYRAKFGAEPALNAEQRQNFFLIWAAYRMGREEAGRAD